MKPWAFILLTILSISGFILILTFLSSLMISMVAKKHSEKTRDATVTALKNMLPGHNCGACGCKTCEEYARAIFTCSMDADLCTQGDEDLPRRLNERMEKFLKELEDDTLKKENTKSVRGK